MSTTPVSVRFRSTATADLLRQEAAAQRSSISALAEELIEEGLRTRRHPLIRFKPGATGRRAAMLTGPDVWELVGLMLEDGPPVERQVEAIAEEFGYVAGELRAAVAYYAEFTQEIDAEIAENNRVREQLEARWRREQALITR